MKNNKIDTILMFVGSNISMSIIVGFCLGIHYHKPMKDDLIVGFFVVNFVLITIFMIWHLVKSFYILFLKTNDKNKEILSNGF